MENLNSKNNGGAEKKGLMDVPPKMKKKNWNDVRKELIKIKKELVANDPRYFALRPKFEARKIISKVKKLCSNKSSQD